MTHLSSGMSDGYHQRCIYEWWVETLTPGDKLDCFGQTPRKKIGSDQNSLAFYPGPVLPPWADGSPLDDHD